jgi:membrane-bound ClpP family serine protease
MARRQAALVVAEALLVLTAVAAFFYSWILGIGVILILLLLPIHELLIDASGVPADRVFPAFGVPTPMSSATEWPDRSHLVGKSATAWTPLRPEGIVVLGGERYTARSDSGFVAKDCGVIVVGVEPNRLLVRGDAPAARSNHSSASRR